MNEIFSEDVSFESLELSEPVLRGITDAGFKHPTHIQAQLIPKVLGGGDLLGQAKTGTGKTAAFGLPILSQASRDSGVQALILAPTRELANQITKEMNDLGRHTGLRAVSIVGGEAYRRQIDGVQGDAQIAVGTPGRVWDLQQKNVFNFAQLRWVVLDEVDRMLDIGFRDDIRRLLSQIRQQHQTVFVSATINPDIERLARQFMRDDAEKIVTVAGSLTVSQVTQNYVPVKPWDKRRMLLHLLKHEETALTVVFCRTKRTVAKVTAHLNRKNVDAYEIHGDLPQSKRNRIIERLRGGNLEVLIASDVASRGLDVEGITHIINYDLPDDPEVYVHRIGRTARAGRSGTAWSLVEPSQGQLLTEIEKLTGVHIQKLEYGDFKESPMPEGWRGELPGGRLAPPQEEEGPPPRSRFREGVGTDGLSPQEAAEVDPELFPGGVVPQGEPRKTLGSRFRPRRGKKKL